MVAKISSIIKSLLLKCTYFIILPSKHSATKDGNFDRLTSGQFTTASPQVSTPHLRPVHVHCPPVVVTALKNPTSSISKTCVKRPLSKRQKIGFQDQLLLHAGQKYCRMLKGEHSTIISTFIKLPFVIKVLFCLFLSGRFHRFHCIFHFPENCGHHCSNRFVKDVVFRSGILDITTDFFLWGGGGSLGL